MGSTLPDATGLELIAQRVRESVGDDVVTAGAVVVAATSSRASG